MNPLRRAVDALAELSVVGSYSSIGYRLRAPTFSPLDVDLSGRSVVITGASSGIGEAAAHILAGRRANVLLLVRDAARGEAVARSLPPPADGDHLVVPVDLSDLEAGYEVLGGLLDTFIDSYNEAYEEKISSKNKSVFALLPNRISEDIPDDLYLRLLRIIDFVSGMTDSFAVPLFRKIKGISLPGGRVTE